MCQETVKMITEQKIVFSAGKLLSDSLILFSYALFHLIQNNKSSTVSDGNLCSLSNVCIVGAALKAVVSYEIPAVENGGGVRLSC